MSIHILIAISHNVTPQVMRKSLHSWSRLTMYCDNPLVFHVKWDFTVGVSPCIFLIEVFHFMLSHRRMLVCRCGTVLHVHTALNTKFSKNQFALFELIHAHRLTYCEYKSVHSYANVLNMQLLVSGSNFLSLKFTRRRGGGVGEQKLCFQM